MDPKHTEVYCGMVHLIDDHQANESTDGHQYCDDVGGGCENHDCAGGKLSHQAVHHFPSITCAPKPSSVLAAKTQAIIESHCGS